jgi:hypothetical protein
MTEKELSQDGLEPSAASGAHPADWTPPPRDLRLQAFWGGMLAGVALGLALAAVMYVVQHASPKCVTDGCPGDSIGGNVVLVLFLGLVIGFGLGIGLAAVAPMPAKTAAPAQPETTRPGQSR